MSVLVVVLLVDIVVFYNVFTSIKDTEKTMGTRTECRRISRILRASFPGYSCTYRYYVEGIEYNEEDTIKHIKKFPTGIETEIYYKKETPTRIITKCGIKSLAKTLIGCNVAALCFFVFMQIMALY